MPCASARVTDGQVRYGHHLFASSPAKTASESIAHQSQRCNVVLQYTLYMFNRRWKRDCVT